MKSIQEVMDTAGSIPSAKIGSSTDYIEVEPDGTVKSVGTSTLWDDIVGSLVARRLTSTVGTLNYNYDENTITMQSGGGITDQNDRLIFNFQYPHAAITDGEMRLHIHWEQDTATTREFTVQYRIQSNGTAKTTAWTQVVVDSNTNNIFTYTSGTINQITELVAIDMTGAGISATVQFRLARTDSNSGDVEATFVDAHVEMDTNGSREEYSK